MRLHIRSFVESSSQCLNSIRKPFFCVKIFFLKNFQQCEIRYLCYLIFMKTFFIWNNVLWKHSLKVQYAFLKLIFIKSFSYMSHWYLLHYMKSYFIWKTKEFPSVHTSNKDIEFEINCWSEFVVYSTANRKHPYTARTLANRQSVREDYGRLGKCKGGAREILRIV